MRTFLLLLFAYPAICAEYTMEFTPENTKIHWTLADPLHTVHGTFALTAGRVVFDPESGKASGQITVDVSSGESGSGIRDRRMHSNVLESSRFPDARFTPDHVEGALAPQGDATLKFRGMLAIHGASHEVTMDAKTTVVGNTVKAAITCDIPYVKWGMKDPGNLILKVSKTVRLDIVTSGTLQSRSAVP